MVTKGGLRIVDVISGHYEIDLGDKVLSIYRKNNLMRFVNGSEVASIVVDASNSGVIIVGRDAVARFDRDPDGNCRVLHYTDRRDKVGEYRNIHPIDYVLSRLEAHSQGL